MYAWSDVISWDRIPYWKMSRLESTDVTSWERGQATCTTVSSGHLHQMQGPPKLHKWCTRTALMQIYCTRGQETALQMILRFQCVLHLIVSAPGPFLFKKKILRTLLMQGAPNTTQLWVSPTYFDLIWMLIAPKLCTRVLYAGGAPMWFGEFGQTLERVIALCVVSICKLHCRQQKYINSVITWTKFWCFICVFTLAVILVLSLGPEVKEREGMYEWGLHQTLIISSTPAIQLVPFLRTHSTRLFSSQIQL